MVFRDTEGFNIDRTLVHEIAQDASVYKSRWMVEGGLGVVWVPKNNEAR